MEAERVLLSIGGPWRIYNYFLLCFTKFIQAFAMFGNVFLGRETSHHCHIPEGYNITESIPHQLVDDKLVPDKCLVYKNFSQSTNETESCPDGWTYGPEIYSTVESWDLVCERDYLVAMSQTVLVGGVLCGAFITTIFADKYGRKPVLLFSMVAIGVIGCITAAVNDYYIFTTLQFFTGVFQQGVVLPSFVICCELFPCNKRALWPIIYNGVFWSTGCCLLVLIAYLIPNWRHLLIAISLPGFIGILYYWLLTESPSWLMAKMRYKEVKSIIQQSLNWDKNATKKKKVPTATLR